MPLLSSRILSLAIVLFTTSGALLAQDFLSQARTLYEAAAYEDALKLLDGAATDSGAASQQQAARDYRALCFIALNRPSDAEKTIEQMIDVDPFYRPTGDSPPRLLAAFDQVHRQMLPAIIGNQFAHAKADFDARRYLEAVNGFERVLGLARSANTELADESDRQPFAQIEALTTTLLHESQSAQEKSLQKSLPQPGPMIYSSVDADITPPVPIRQEIPVWQGATPNTGSFEGELAVVIGTTGDVQAVTITTPIEPAYDRMILEAARKWKYRPATKAGHAVLYRKTIFVSLAPQKPTHAHP